MKVSYKPPIQKNLEGFFAPSHAVIGKASRCIFGLFLTHQDAEIYMKGLETSNYWKLKDHEIVEIIATQNNL